MKAVILAAGIASRLRPLTDNTPKCLLPVGDSSILDRALGNLQREGLREVVLVTGYREQQIREAVAARFPDLAVTFVRNPVYDTTNNIYSLWLAAEALAGDGMLLLDSDIVFDHRILGTLRASGRENCLAVTTGATLGDEEIKVLTDGDARVLDISKEVPPDHAFGESIGIECFSPGGARRLFEEIDRLVVEEQQVNVFYERAFKRAIDAGMPLHAVDVTAYACMEIDTADDLAAAAREVLPRLPA
jgi:choline kinase